MLPFGPPSIILSDNASTFTSAYTREFAESQGIGLRTVSPNSSQANGRAERMIQTIKRAVHRSLQDPSLEWDQLIPQVLYGYRRRKQADGISPFELLYATTSRLYAGDALSTTLVPAVRQIQALHVSALRASRQLPIESDEKPDSRWET
jgi:transposase InsO family protein